jgi:hypothetical protein
MGIFEDAIKRINVKTVFKPGERVLKSGIYEVLHDEDNPHHEVTCVAGKTFPGSRSCPHPRYRLVREAVHIDDHQDTER